MISTILSLFPSFQPGLRLIDGQDLLNQANLLFSVKTGITAHPGGGQASAVQLVAALNEVDTVTTGSDSVMLPSAVPGTTVTINNAGGASLQVFGQVSNPNNAGLGDTIVAHNSDAAAATVTGVAQGDTVQATYTCYKLGVWKQSVSA